MKIRENYCRACNNFNHWHEEGEQCTGKAINEKYGTCWCRGPWHE